MNWTKLGVHDLFDFLVLAYGVMVLAGFVAYGLGYLIAWFVENVLEKKP